MARIYVLLLALVLVPVALAQDCSIDAESTDAFFDEIPALDAKLADCQVRLPSPMDRLFATELINVQVVRNDGSKDVFRITTQDGVVTDITKGSSNTPTYVATLAECAFDNVLKSDDKGKALAYLYDKRHLTIGPYGVWRSIVFRVTMFFARGAISSNAEEIPVTCPKKRVGELCDHGGQCESGNCIGIIPGQVYKCSCDPFKFVGGDTNGKCPPTTEYPSESSGKPGDLCQHGGQCETGNCIGVIPGQVYKCSCDPFKFDVTSC